MSGEKAKARSVAQKNFFSLVKAVQDKKLDPSDVTKNVRDAAKDAKPDDVDDIVTTKTDKLPDRIQPKKIQPEMVETPITRSDTRPDPAREMTPTPQPQGQEDANPSIAEVMHRFNEYGAVLKSGSTLRELSEKLMEIADLAENALVNELASDWYDAHTIKRNIKEARKYVEEFQKVATEHERISQRAQALYDDCGRIYNRYFEIRDLEANASVESARDKFASEAMNTKIFETAKQKLPVGQRVLFESLDPNKKMKVAMRLLLK